MGFKNSRGPISEINVTPLVDVMLVLLVIFMITAPLMHSAIQLKLPKTKKVNSIKLSKEQLILSVSPELEFFIGDQKVLKGDLVDQVLKRFEHLEKKVLYIRADYSIQYGEVAKLMANLKKEGISNIALVTENSNDS